MPDAFAVDGRPIGPGHPPWVIAEVSGNHNGSLERALAIVDAAGDAGADALKLQTYTADTLTIDHDGPGFRIEGGLWSGRSLHDLYRDAHTPWEWHEELFSRARERGMTPFSSPFDESAIELLERLGAPAYKIASPEVIDLGLIRAAATTGKPLIISTGMASLGEIEAAIDVARASGCGQLALLHCVSGYPTPPAELRLATIGHLAAAFGVPVGLSDHSIGIGASIAGVALGASILERHLTLDRASGGVDSAFSLEPHELSTLVTEAGRAWEAAFGEVDYRLTEAERGSLGFRRSLYVVADVAAGQLLTRENVRSIRPSHGLPPSDLDDVLGARAARDLRRGEPLHRGMVQFEE